MSPYLDFSQLIEPDHPRIGHEASELFMEGFEAFESLVKDGHEIREVDIDELLQICLDVLDVDSDLFVLFLVLDQLAIHNLYQLIGMLFPELKRAHTTVLLIFVEHDDVLAQRDFFGVLEHGRLLQLNVGLRQGRQQFLEDQLALIQDRFGAGFIPHAYQYQKGQLLSWTAIPIYMSHLQYSQHNQQMPQPPKQPNQKSALRELNPEKYDYEYFKDTEGRLKRFRRPKDLQSSVSRPGYIRLRFLERYYIWWKRKSFDFKLMILPWVLGFSGLFVIYQFSMMWSQNDLQREIKAKLPFELNKEVVDKMKELYKEDQKNHVTTFEFKPPEKKSALM